MSLLLALLSVVGLAAAAPLTGGPRLAVIYDHILDAQFDRADAELKDACPPAPVEACQALGTVSVWWRIQIDPETRRLDRTLGDRAAAAIDASEAWTRREPDRAEAWFYLAGSYAPLVNFRVLRGDRLAAARDGAKIKSALERALQLDPALEDAHFGIGLYHYYADVAPAALKLLRWLLLLPGGDRATGLEEMREARDRGELLRGEADFQLQFVYLWYEQRPADALDILESLDARYPNNPLFLEHIANVYDVYFHDLDASASAWRRLIDRARHERVYEASRVLRRAETKLRALDARAKRN